MQKLTIRFSKREDILIYIGFSFQILKSLKNHIENHVTFLKSLAKKSCGLHSGEVQMLQIC